MNFVIYLTKGYRKLMKICCDTPFIKHNKMGKFYGGDGELNTSGCYTVRIV